MEGDEQILDAENDEGSKIRTENIASPSENIDSPSENILDEKNRVTIYDINVEKPSSSETKRLVNHLGDVKKSVSPYMCKTPFMLETDIIKANKKTLPSVEEEVIKAKQFLKRQGNFGDTLYDHLADVIQKVLLYQPNNIVDYIEIFSSDLKEDRFQSNFDRLRNEYILSKKMEDTIKLHTLYKEMKARRENEISDTNFEIEINAEELNQESPLKIPNVIESNFYFRQAGFGLPDWEIYNLSIALNKFVSTKPVILTKVRFFGKIFGTKMNYYILETELTLDEMDKRLAPKESSKQQLPVQEETKSEDNEEHIEREKSFRSEMGESEGMEERPKEEPYEEPVPELPPLPVSKWQPPKEIAAEKLGEGLNVKVYWVCNNLGDDWTSLPEVQPKHIDIARNLTTCLTGNLDKEMHTYPPFDGTERDYLRAQIARIAGATMVSPIEYYVRGVEGQDDEEEEEEMEGEDDNVTQIKKNKHYEGHPLSDLIDNSMSFWVHHSPYVLKQGRVSWWNPYAKEMAGEGEEDEEEAEGEDEDTGVPGELRESSLPLLVPLSEEEGASDWWSVRPASQLQPATGPILASLRSRRWPGAVAYATTDGKFDNIYVGWGLKYIPEGYSPPLLPPVCSEYPLGPEIMEVMDPTVEEEEEFRIANLPPLPPLEMAGEGEEMEGEYVE